MTYAIVAKCQPQGKEKCIRERTRERHSVIPDTLPCPAPTPVVSSVQGTCQYTDEHGVMIPTGKQRSDRERQRAERLAALLHQAGIDPDQV